VRAEVKPLTNWEKADLHGASASESSGDGKWIKDWTRDWLSYWRKAGFLYECPGAWLMSFRFYWRLSTRGRGSSRHTFLVIGGLDTIHWVELQKWEWLTLVQTISSWLIWLAWTLLYLCIEASSVTYKDLNLICSSSSTLQEKSKLKRRALSNIS